MFIVQLYLEFFLRVHAIVIGDVYPVNVVRWECDSFQLREIAVDEVIHGLRSWSSCYQENVRREIPVAAFGSVVTRSDSARLLDGGENVRQ